MSHEHDTGTGAPDFVRALIREAEEAGASDIHLQMNGRTGQISFRLDGVLVPLKSVSEELAERVVGRIKFLARLKTYQVSEPQDGRIDRAEVQSAHDIRVATYPTVTGEKIVLRLFGGAGAKTLTELGLPQELISALERFLRQSSGLLLLTGPAGSGKTTTIYSCLRFLAENGGRQVITIEDPVEQIVSGIMQTEVNEARGLTFAKAARHLLRQDPQVLVIGEIRDEETANIAIRAAQTGHLMIATLHAGSCRGVFERLLDLADDDYSAVSVVHFVLNQRLVRRLCPECNGAGCLACLSTGYRGRVPLAEWLELDENLRQRIRKDGPSIISPGRSLQTSARELLNQRLSNETELVRVLGHTIT